MNEIFAKMALSSAVGIAVWFMSFLLIAPVFEVIDSLNEKIGNVLFVIHIYLLPISLLVGFIGLIGFIWTA